MCQVTDLASDGKIDITLTRDMCYRYYESDAALKSHWRSKVHKRRCKALKEPAYTIEESERAAGLGREGKRPAIDVTS
jgi:hypothetical protein